VGADDGILAVLLKGELCGGVVRNTAADGFDAVLREFAAVRIGEGQASAVAVVVFHAWEEGETVWIAVVGSKVAVRLHTANPVYDLAERAIFVRRTFPRLPGGATSLCIPLVFWITGVGYVSQEIWVHVEVGPTMTVWIRGIAKGQIADTISAAEVLLPTVEIEVSALFEVADGIDGAADCTWLVISTVCSRIGAGQGLEAV